jgi:hypothetical protein
MPGKIITMVNGLSFIPFTYVPLFESRSWTKGNQIVIYCNLHQKWWHNTFRAKPPLSTLCIIAWVFDKVSLSKSRSLPKPMELSGSSHAFPINSFGFKYFEQNTDLPYEIKMNMQ